MGAPQGLTGAPPTTMIGPLNATKLELHDNTGGYNVAGILAINASAAVAFIQFFDQPAAGVTLGTTIPSFIVPVKANDWSYISFAGMQLNFNTPITVASTTTPVGTVGSSAGVYMQTFVN